MYRLGLWNVLKCPPLQKACPWWWWDCSHCEMLAILFLKFFDSFSIQGSLAIEWIILFKIVGLNAELIFLVVKGYCLGRKNIFFTLGRRVDCKKLPDTVLCKPYSSHIKQYLCQIYSHLAKLCHMHGVLHYGWVFHLKAWWSLELTKNLLRHCWLELLAH